jgi:hypothetical protein
MPESLLDECHESILKMAETQPPDGKRAILAIAKMFWTNSGRPLTVSLHRHKTFIRAIGSRRFRAGFDRAGMG